MAKKGVKMRVNRFTRFCLLSVVLVMIALDACAPIQPTETDEPVEYPPTRTVEDVATLTAMMSGFIITDTNGNEALYEWDPHNPSSFINSDISLFQLYAETQNFNVCANIGNMGWYAYYFESFGYYRMVVVYNPQVVNFSIVTGSEGYKYRPPGHTSCDPTIPTPTAVVTEYDTEISIDPIAPSGSWIIPEVANATLPYIYEDPATDHYVGFTKGSYGGVLVQWTQRVSSDWQEVIAHYTVQLNVCVPINTPNGSSYGRMFNINQQDLITITAC